LHLGLNSLHVSLTPISNINRSGGKENGGIAFSFQDKKLLSSVNLSSMNNNQNMNSPSL